MQTFFVCIASHGSFAADSCQNDSRKLTLVDVDAAKAVAARATAGLEVDVRTHSHSELESVNS